MESQYNFLHVKNGRTYFARVAVVADAEIEGVRLSENIKLQQLDVPELWLKAACFGAERALQGHVKRGGGKVGLTVNSVYGTEVDTNANTIEVAAFYAAWQALGHEVSELNLEFDKEWRVK